jgi:virginiamycin A acetyltransferase
MEFWIADPASRARRIDQNPNRLLSCILLWLYRIRWIRKLVRRLAARTEGGEFYSRTLRQILEQYHGVRVGFYSYGAILVPTVLPPGSIVGRYCSVGKELIVRRRNHPIRRLSQHPFFYNSALGYLRHDTIPADADNPLTIGHDVWIGDRVTIVSGCKRIGNGAVIAAGAVVTKDVAPYTIVAGCPAMVKGERFEPQTIQQIESSEWWNLALSDLFAKREDLINPPLGCPLPSEKRNKDRS